MAGKEKNSKKDEKKYPRKKEEFPFWSERIQKAFEVGQKAHEGQTRKTSGEPYFNHCVAVAGIIESWVSDPRPPHSGASLSVDTERGKWNELFVEDLICAALLHDTVEDTKLTLEDIRKMFGDEVAFLVDGVSKFKSEGLEGSDHETIKKVLEGYFVDPRVVILKLADRIHNMETLGDMPMNKQGPKAWETEEIYARMAEALGMWKVMRELKDGAFPIRFPERYRMVKEIMDRDPRRSEGYIAAMCNDVRMMVGRGGVEAEIGWRLSGLRQIDQKRRKMGRPIGENGYEGVSEVLSIGIRVKTVEDCYRMLGLMRAHFGGNIDQSRSADTIAVRADNGYQALKEVVNLGFGAVELVIMTGEMEEFNNWGVISLIKKGVEDLGGYRMKFVFTPDGEVRVLPLTASLWDVAAAISSKLVTMMVAVKVDGQYELPSVQVPHGTTVEVIAGKRIGSFVSDRSWESASFGSTKRVLRQALEEVDYRQSVELGMMKARKMLTSRGMLTFGDIRDEITPLLSLLGCRNIDELLFAIGDGEIDQERLDSVLDHGNVKINKESLGLTTVSVRGRNAKGILYHLTGVINHRGGDIVRSVNRDNWGIFEIRIVIRGLGREQEGALREELERDGRYTEVLVV